MKKSVKAAVLFASMLLTPLAYADTNTSAALIANNHSTNLEIVGFMTLLSLLPALLLSVTAFPRILIALSLLRQALGTSSNPTNKILIGVAFMLTIFVMNPQLTEIKDNAIVPYLNHKISDSELLDRSVVPVRKFMMNQTRRKDIDLFLSMSNTKITNKDQVPFFVLTAAYMTSELQTGFQIGFLMFIPFIIIDLVVASSLMGLGMMMVSPTIVSIPLKIMVFVLVDGWTLTLGTLARSFYMS